MDSAENLARLWEREGHPLVQEEVPWILFDPASRESVLQAVMLLKPEVAESFLGALVRVTPLADLGMQALARRSDARREVLERLLENFWSRSDLYQVPQVGLRALRDSTHPQLATWATDWAFALLKEKWGSVVEFCPWVIQRKITRIIGLLGQPQAIGLLTVLWDNLEGDDTLAMECGIAEALGLIGGLEAVEALVARWNHREGREAQELHKEIIAALADSGEPGALASLLKVAKPSEVAAGRHFQLEALCGREPVEVLLAWLAQLPSEGAWGLHNAIEKALTDYFSQEPEDTLLARWDAATGQGTGYVQSAIAKAFGKRAEYSDIDALLERLSRFQDETNWHVQQELASVLERLFVKEPVAVLLERWDRAEGYTAWRIQVALAGALQKIGDQTAVPALLVRWESAEGEKAHAVQRAIAEVVGTLGDSTHLDILLRYWDAAEGEGAITLQEALASAIGELGNPRGVGALLERWDTAQAERDLSVSVLRAIGNLGGNNAITLLFDKWDYFVALSQRRRHDYNTDILLYTIACVLGRIGNEAVLAGLLERWEHVERQRLYTNAGIKGALEELFAQESPERLYERWGQATGSKSEEIRAVIAKVLETKFRAEQSVSYLMAQWNCVEGEQADLVKCALLRALGAHASVGAVDALLEHRDSLDHEENGYLRTLRRESLEQLGLTALPRIWETWCSPAQTDTKRAAMGHLLFALAARA
ncbi:HEAT repeat domain-containing protein [Armatimonas rosea]|uniref:HEAT repeat protein n=1 Tax=Armatimonas rosea TaxID=685828 RepID=A0A7W9W4S1_ARMRO|nr:hypothetical protein [Armatimonas rosea]MBB6049699.1 HEAT repeat protein [Armatimonas rosea]